MKHIAHITKRPAIAGTVTGLSTAEALLAFITKGKSLGRE